MFVDGLPDHSMVTAIILMATVLITVIAGAWGSEARNARG